MQVSSEMHYGCQYECSQLGYEKEREKEKEVVLDDRFYCNLAVRAQRTSIYKEDNVHQHAAKKSFKQRRQTQNQSTQDSASCCFVCSATQMFMYCTEEIMQTRDMLNFGQENEGSQTNKQTNK